MLTGGVLGERVLGEVTVEAITATASPTIGAFVTVATGLTTDRNAVLTQTLGAVTLVATVEIPPIINAVVAATLAPVTLSAAAYSEITADASPTIGAFGLIASIEIPPIRLAVVNATLGAVTLAGTGTVQSVSATLAATLGPVTLTATAALPIAGAVAQTLAAVTLSAQGFVGGHVASVNATIPGAFTTVAPATVKIVGLLAKTIGPVTTAASAFLVVDQRAAQAYARKDYTEALAILMRMMDSLAEGFLGATGRSGFAFRHAIGDVKAHGEAYLRTGTLSDPLLVAFAAARDAGSTARHFETVVDRLRAEAPVSLIAIAVVMAGQRFALAQMARIIAAGTFATRAEADAALTRIGIVFDLLEEDAADLHDTESYRAITTLHAAVTRDLVDRALLLPRMVNIRFGRTMPSLWLANRVYQDGERADEIVAENKIVHPAFCPRDLQCLSQ